MKKRNQRMRKTRIVTRFITLCLMCTLTSFFIGCAGKKVNEQKSLANFEKAQNYELEESYYDAAKAYKNAELYSGGVDTKANMLLCAARAYKSADYQYQEFLCLQDLLEMYPATINFTETVQRMYAIGDNYYRDYREPSSHMLAWTGLKGQDRTLEVYEAALKYAPAVPEAIETRLRVGRLLLLRNTGNDAERGIEYLRDVVRNDPGTKAEKGARLELGNVLYQRSINGDGDEANGNEAREILNAYATDFPNDPAMPFVRETLQKLSENSAKRHLETARFYHKNDNDAGAARELRLLLSLYPATESAREGESLLEEIEPNLLHNMAENTPPSNDVIINERPVLERRDILITPGAQDGKYLLPIEDYSWDLGENDAQREKLRQKSNTLKKAEIAPEKTAEQKTEESDEK